MTDYKKLSEALQAIKDECKKHNRCGTCPFSMEVTNNSGEWTSYLCAIRDATPSTWKIKPLSVIRLLESE